MIDDDDDAPADSCGPVLAETLTNTSPLVGEIVRRHIEDNDEVLSTILLGEIGRWYTAAIRHEDGKQNDAEQVAQAIARLFIDGDDEMETVIATGFLEALPQRGDPDRQVVDRLPRPLLDELLRMESWVPPSS